MLHRRTVDNAPYGGDLLRHNCIRYSVNPIVDAYAIQIHGPNTGVVRRVAAGFATKDGVLLIAVLLLDGFTAHKARLALTVVSRNNEIDSSVNADHLADVGTKSLWNVRCDRDMQKVFAVFSDQLGCAKTVKATVKILFHTARKMRQFHPAIQRVDREPFAGERIVPVPYEVVLRFCEGWLHPLMLVLQDSFEAGNYGLHHRL